MSQSWPWSTVVINKSKRARFEYQIGIQFGIPGLRAIFSRAYSLRCSCDVLWLVSLSLPPKYLLQFISKCIWDCMHSVFLSVGSFL